ncbi:MAG: CBS domain-containing protein, partial [Betaproteobacteria bacterium]
MEERPIRTIIGEQKPVSAGAETSVAAAAKLMKRHRIGALLVTKSGQLAGIFTERDALFRV